MKEITVRVVKTNFGQDEHYELHVDCETMQALLTAKFKHLTYDHHFGYFEIYPKGKTQIVLDRLLLAGYKLTYKHLRG